MKNDIKVYDIEKTCGLEERIQTESSIAFTSELVLQDTKQEVPYDNLDIFSASSVDDPDLFHVYSILVSTVWNRNDDIFNKEEVWVARDTPKFKPTNLEHDEKQMVGGIIESWPVDADFNLIAGDTNVVDLPEEYHILVSSVIYKQWQDPELRARAEQLISEIQDGTKYVSMECVFKGFDYGVVDLEGKNHVIARNENTAFLSQHLRSYGGEGLYQGHKLGRVLRNITFSGKGFVERPANPDSIIFDKNHTFSFANAKTSKSVFFDKNGVTNNTTEKQLSSEVNISIKGNKMSNEILSDQVKELKDALAAAEAENKDLNEKLAHANVSAYENKIQELESAVAEFETKFQDLDSQLSETNDSKAKIELEMKTKSEELDSLKADMHMMHEEKKKTDRKDKMVEAGLTEDEAEAKIEVFANLDEESFKAFIETVADMHYKKKKKEEEEDKDAEANIEEDTIADEEQAEETEAAELVEEVTEEGDVAVSSETEETELSTARAGLGQWVESIITK